LMDKKLNYSQFKNFHESPIQIWIRIHNTEGGGEGGGGWWLFLYHLNASKF
jgi:hypothetical protein